MPVAAVVLVAAAATGVAATIGTAVAATLIGATVSTAAATAIGTGIIAGGLTAAQGGSVSDVLKSAVVGGVATYVGGYVGDVVGTSVASATGSTLAGTIVGNVASGVAQAVVRGQDLETGAIAGLASSAGTVLGNIPGFKDLPKPVQAAVTATARAAVTGGNVPSAVAQSLITSTGILDSAIKSIPGSSTVLADTANKDVVQLVTGTLSGALTAALQNKNVGEAAQRALINTSADILAKNLFDGIAREQLKKDVAATQAKYNTAQDAQKALQSNYESQTYYAEKYNAIVNTVKGMGTEHERLVKDYNDKRATWQQMVDSGDTAGANAYVENVNAAAKAADDYVAKYNKYWEDNKGTLETYKTKLEELKTAYTPLEKTFTDASKTLQDASTALGKNVGTFTDNSNQAFVSALDPNFNAAQYRAINNLGADVDVYEHYLSTGMFQGLATNDKAAEPYLAAERNRIIGEVAAAKGVTIDQLASADKAQIIEKLNANYGKNFGALNTVTGAQLVKDAGGADKLLPVSAQNRYQVNADTAYGNWKLPPPNRYDIPDGFRYATPDEVNRGLASHDTTRDGQTVWVYKDVGQGTPRFDPETGQWVHTHPTIIVRGVGARQPSDVERLKVAAEQDPKTDKTFGAYIINAAKATLNWAKETGNSTIINTAANVIKAGGGFLESINGISVLAGYAPKNTALGKFADALQGIGKAGNTTEYQAAIKNMQQMIGDAKGVGGTLKAIYGAFKSAPLEFLAEYVGVEGIQEVAPLLIGGAASAGAKGATLALKYGEAVAARIGAGAGLSAAMTTDIIESAGGSAKSAYDEAYATAIKAGKSAADADKIALDIAQRSALVAAGTTAVSMGVGGAAVEKALLGKTGTGLGDALQSLGDFAKTGTKIAIKEGVAEAGEEGVIQAFLEGQLYKLDPNRDVAGNITAAAAFGAIAGGPIAGGAYAGSRTGDVISNALLANPTVANTINNAPNAATAASELGKLGVADNVTQANLLNTKFDSAYTSSAEAEAALGKRTDFTYSDADVKALTGATSNVNLAGAVEQYVDPRVLDVGEVKAAAAAEGYTITDEQAAQLAGQKDEASGVAAARAQFDPLATNYDEAKSFFTSRGYTPSADEIRSFVGSKAEADQTKAVADYVNPRQVTAEEARKYLTDLGYKPTDAEVNRFVGQVNEASQATAIGQYVDPRMVDEAEVKAAYEALGLKKPTTSDVQKLIGQYSESELTGKATANLDSARYNSIIEQLDGLTTGASQEVLDAVALVKKDLNAQVEALGGDIATLSNDVAKAKTDLGKAISDFQTGAGTRFDSIDTAIKALQDAGLTPEQVSTIINEQLGPVTTRIDAIQNAVGTSAAANMPTSDDANKALQIAVGRLPYDAKYDWNGDGKVTSADALNLAKLAQGRETSPMAAGLPWGQPTGVYKAIADAQSNLQTAISDAQKGNTTRFNDIDASIKALKEAGLTTDQVQTLIDTSATGLSKDFKAALDAAAEGNATALSTLKGDLETKIGGVQTALETALGEQKTAFDTKVKELMDQGKTYQEATELALKDVGVKIDDLGADFTTKLKNTSDALGRQITDLSTQLKDAESAIYTKMAEYEKAGIARDEALSKAIADVASDLGTTKDDLLKQIGTTEANLKTEVGNVETNLGTKITESQEAILKELGLVKTGLSEEIEGAKEAMSTALTDVETNILNRMADYEKAGISRDEALGRAVDDVATQLGTTRDDILTKIGQTEATLKGDISTAKQEVLDRAAEYEKAGIARDEALTRAISDTEQRLGTKIGDLQTTVGQKATPATQQDLDAIINLLETQGAYDPNLDYNGDKVIDQKDKIAIETVLRSQQPDYIPDANQPFKFLPAPGTKWSPTGIFGEIGDTQRLVMDEAARTRAANEQAALKTQRLGNLNTMMQMLGQAGDVGGQQVTVKAADPSKIGYIYDWSSIFANPSQEQMFVTPYAQGGAVRSEMDDVNDELLKFLRG